MVWNKKTISYESDYLNVINKINCFINELMEKKL